jgi:hypothetical protein
MPLYDRWERDGASFRSQVGKTGEYVGIAYEVYHPGSG